MTFVKPRVIELLVRYSLNLFTLGRVFAHIFSQIGLGGRETFSGGNFRKMSIEILFFVSMAKFIKTVHLSHHNDGSTVGRSRTVQSQVERVS